MSKTEEVDTNPHVMELYSSRRTLQPGRGLTRREGEGRIGEGARAEFCKANFRVWIGGTGDGRRWPPPPRAFLDSDS